MNKKLVKNLNEVRVSVLDLAPIVQGGSVSESLKHTVDLAKHVERWGYHRYWLAEHHNMPGIASSATSIVIGHVAASTSSIRVGSGGIMLPNHAPLIIAEQFGTLESLFPGRIDLGLGRAPGTDQLTVMALRRDSRSNGQDFPEQLDELRSYFSNSKKTRTGVRAIPGEGLNIPIWLLGSSGFSARLAAHLGLPFAFASHFSPNNTLAALNLYYNEFLASDDLVDPYAMIGINVIAADTDKEAQILATSMQQAFLNLIRNNPSQLPPPVESMEDIWNEYERSILHNQFAYSIVGSHQTVERKLNEFLLETKADEIIISSMVYDHQARLRSYEIVAEVIRKYK
ncbi:LLM class flavin-dependent oxidoreductase [Bacillus salitolerans]|uniref:LLM class flavin-dependent oxidoreductase n=1 Tax=Bacillus salitolerans TaxID=1437434 RepID=A0ABW4LQK8_9BACI